MSSLRQLKVTFDSFDDLVESIVPGLSRTHLFARTDEEIAAGTRLRFELGTVRKGAAIRGVAKIAGPGDEASEPGLHLHIIHLDPSSTRLVDSLVRGELAAAGAGEASGPSPFDIPASEPGPEAEDDSGPEASESPAAATSRLRRFAWPLALAVIAAGFLLVFEIVTGRGDRLLTGRDRQTAISEPTAGDPAAGDGGRETRSPPSADPPEVVEESPAETAAPETEAVAVEVEQLVYSWADAWSRQDPGAYLELYAPDYSPADLDRESWRRQRRARITAPERLVVRISELEVESVGEGRAIARFHQLYSTGDKALAARKILELERLSAGWKIVGERLEQ